MYVPSKLTSKPIFNVAPAKGKPAKKASKARKSTDNAPQAPRVAPKGAKAGKRASKAEMPVTARQGSKTQQILDLLKRHGGASLKEIMTATDWQPHSVRGFISGALGKKMGLSVESTKGEDGPVACIMESFSSSTKSIFAFVPRNAIANVLAPFDQQPTFRAPVK